MNSRTLHTWPVTPNAVAGVRFRSRPGPVSNCSPGAATQGHRLAARLHQSHCFRLVLACVMPRSFADVLSPRSRVWPFFSPSSTSGQVQKGRLAPSSLFPRLATLYPSAGFRISLILSIPTPPRIIPCTLRGMNPPYRRGLFATYPDLTFSENISYNAITPFETVTVFF